MQRFGVTAPQQHGKSTFAELVREIEPSTLHIETSDIIGEVADAFHVHMPIPPLENNIEWMNKWLKVLPAILKETVHVETDYLQLQFTQQNVERDFKSYEKFFWHSVRLAKDPGLAEQKITPENKSHYRPILQWLGGYLVQKVTPTIWYDEIYRRIDIAEEQGTKVAVIGGLRYINDEKVVRSHGDTVIEIFRPGMPEGDLSDPTERERSKITPDIKLLNNGTLDEFRAMTQSVLKDTANGTQKSLYVATNS